MDLKLTLVEHLNELRKRILIALVAFGLAGLSSFPFASNLLEFIKLPAAGLIEKLVFFGPEEAFLIYMRISFLCGWIISLPIILYQVWAFIAPAMEERFKRYIVDFVVFASLSFIMGSFFVYFMILPPALKFLLGFAKDGLEPVISAQKYISFVIGLILAGGLVFQMPVLSFILTKCGIVNHRILRSKYKYAIVIIFIAAAIITPTTDIFNMLILSGPMIFLYEVSIWVSFLAGSKSPVIEKASI